MLVLGLFALRSNLNLSALGFGTGPGARFPLGLVKRKHCLDIGRGQVKEEARVFLFSTFCPGSFPSTAPAPAAKVSLFV